MSRLQTTIESLHLSDGQRQSRLGNLRAVEPATASPQAVVKGNLYVLLELRGSRPASARLYRLLLNTIQGVYYDSAGGITGGITEAILAAHRALDQHNTLYPEDQQRGSVSCVVMRGDELHLGIGGSAMVLIGHPSKVEQFPAELIPAVALLGGLDAPAVELFRTSVGDQALIIQLQQGWVEQVPPRKLAPAALAPDLAAAQEYLEAVAPIDGELAALLVAANRPIQAPEAAPVAAEPILERPAESADTALAPLSEAEAAQPRRRWPWLLAVILPLVLILAATAGLTWRQISRQQQAELLLQGAQADLEAASAEGVPESTARAQLRSAQERAREALALQPGNAQALDLQAEISGALDEVNGVTPLYKLITLQDLGGTGSDPSRVVVQGNRAYLLDRGFDSAVRYRFSEISGLIPETASEPVVQRGDILPDGQVVGELLDITWAQAGGARLSSNLLILDSNGNLLEATDAVGLRPLAVAGRDQWQSPRLISSYNGNLYLLDTGLGRILRYRPGEDGYGNPPENYIEGDASLDFTLAVDMAIDGNIWILYRDGTVQTFFQGRQQPFELQPPPDGPLTQPQALYVGSEAGTAQNLFIADSGEGRIVEYDKDGNYLRQYRPSDQVERDRLRRMRALQVDEIERAFFILTTDGLLRTDIPLDPE